MFCFRFRLRLASYGGMLFWWVEKNFYSLCLDMNNNEFKVFSSGIMYETFERMYNLSNFCHKRYFKRHILKLFNILVIRCQWGEVAIGWGWSGPMFLLYYAMMHFVYIVWNFIINCFVTISSWYPLILYIFLMWAISPHAPIATSPTLWLVYPTHGLVHPANPYAKWCHLV